MAKTELKQMQLKIKKEKNNKKWICINYYYAEVEIVVWTLFRFK